ncbi:hypothetical protein ABPG72_006769 [Tetrahymena utriculariae]
MLTKNTIINAIFKLQCNFEDQDKKQIERIIFNQPSKEQWDQFRQIQQNVKSLYLRSFKLQNQLIISNFTSLKQLFWDCGNNIELEQIPNSFYLELKNLKHLQELNLKLNFYTTLQENYFKDLFVANLQKIITFNKLAIEFNQCCISETNVDDLVENLVFLQNLKHLHIYYHPQSNDQVRFFQKIWLAVSSLNFLQSLSIVFGFQGEEFDQEVDFQKVFKDKPICNSLKHLKLQIIETVQGEDQLKLFKSLSEFKKLEIFVFEQEIHINLKEIDTLLVEVLLNNQDTLKKFDLSLFEFEDGSYAEGDEDLGDAEKMPFKFLDQLKYVQNLEKLKIVSNLFAEFCSIKNLSENAKQCKHLNQFYFEFDMTPFDDLQAEFYKIFDDLITLPYLTNCFVGDKIYAYQARNFKQTTLDIFDVDSSIANYLDPYTISKAYKKYEKQLQINQISIQKLDNIFIQNFLNKKILVQDFVIPQAPPQQNQQTQLNQMQEGLQNIEEIANYSCSSSETYYCEEDQNYSFSSDGSYESNRYNQIFQKYLQEKVIQILKIHIFKDQIDLGLKETLGDLSLIKYFYWDLYI